VIGEYGVFGESLQSEYAGCLELYRKGHCDMKLENTSQGKSKKNRSVCEQTYQETGKEQLWGSRVTPLALLTMKIDRMQGGSPYIEKPLEGGKGVTGRDDLSRGKGRTTISKSDECCWENNSSRQKLHHAEKFYLQESPESSMGMQVSTEG